MAQKYLLIFLIGVCFILGEMPNICAQASTNGVEVIMEGKLYKTVFEYKREQIKKILIRALAPVNLHDFSEEELYGILIEVRKQQTSEAFPKTTLESEDQRIIDGDVDDLKSDQMLEMMRNYRDEHKEAEFLIVDPDKVKSISIEAEAPLQNNSGD